MNQSEFPIGVSVTQRIKQIKQPRGGYINPKDLEVIELSGGSIDDLKEGELTSPILVGTAVDYLTRFMSGTTLLDAFAISYQGASLIGETELFMKYVLNVIDLDDESICNAIRLAGFDSVYRAGPTAYRPVEEINPDPVTIENVRTMVRRSLAFLRQYGPKVLDGATFEGGYTETISFGDMDFLTEDTLWDFKVSKATPKSDHTLQLLVYWRMGLHSDNKKYFKPIKYLGIYNPRMNKIFRIAIDKISPATIKEVDEFVIGY